MANLLDKKERHPTSNAISIPGLKICAVGVDVWVQFAKHFQGNVSKKYHCVQAVTRLSGGFDQSPPGCTWR